MGSECSVVFCTCAKSDKHGVVPEGTVSVRFQVSSPVRVFARSILRSRAPRPECFEVFRLGSLAAMSWSKGEQAQQDLWSALVTVAEADMEDASRTRISTRSAKLRKPLWSPPPASRLPSRRWPPVRPPHPLPRQFRRWSPLARSLSRLGWQLAGQQPRSPRYRGPREPFPRRPASWLLPDLRSPRSPRLVQLPPRRL